MSSLTEFIKNIIIIAVALSFSEILLPTSEMGKYVKFVFSLVLLAAIISPIIRLLS